MLMHDTRSVCLCVCRIFLGGVCSLLFLSTGLFEARGMDWDFVASLLHQSLEENEGDLAAAAFQLLSTAFARGKVTHK